MSLLREFYQYAYDCRHDSDVDDVDDRALDREIEQWHEEKRRAEMERRQADEKQL